ncbi:ion transporter [Allostella sp. ATCC 35155]|nr:ion transporter [Stella sp. ATCC 35155]
MTEPTTLRDRLRALYFGTDPAARRFRYGLVGFDLVTILLFIVTASIEEPWWLVPVDFAIGLVLLAEFAARHYAETNRRRHLMSLVTLADIVIIVSLFLPAFIDNLGFLRVARSLRLLRSYHLLRDLRMGSPWFRRYEDVIQRSINLGVFIFVVTSLVYVTQHYVNPGIQTYLDALYFTLTTLTTTGFGDITLIGPGGRLLAIVIMVVGVALFLRLLQAVFRPNKVRFECPDCALQIHDADAVHCKHCGRVLAIPTEGQV